MAHTAQQLGGFPLFFFFFFLDIYLYLSGWSWSWSLEWELGSFLFPFFSFGTNHPPDTFPAGSRMDGRRCPSSLPVFGRRRLVAPFVDHLVDAPVHTTDIPCTLPILFFFCCNFLVGSKSDVF